MTYFGLKDVFFVKKMAKRQKMRETTGNFDSGGTTGFWKIYTNNTATWKR